MSWPVRILAVLTTAASLLSACSDAESANVVASAEPEAEPVEIVTANLTQLAKPVEAFGTIAARQSSAIGALVEGPVRVFVQVGDRVSKGDPLLRVRRSYCERRVEEAEAAVALARAQTEQSERQLERVAALAPRVHINGESGTG
ncbi:MULTISPECIES: efflux RND transporter periplasmic adaptor subunit [Pacificimonas]|uniref:Biotin/lipoyl-binding protein n=1 Tax=Pacificimonas aurantium TaxID=1250540 RepID=A0ABS7WGC3_9SPHN|nr:MULTISPECIES: hypothetical protein [Pacificimonas]MBZ6377111.1 hypothetical protein [Pacificimonas aurantium]